MGYFGPNKNAKLMLMNERLGGRKESTREGTDLSFIEKDSYHASHWEKLAARQALLLERDTSEGSRR
jgi:hypothetical protein